MIPFDGEFAENIVLPLAEAARAHVLVEQSHAPGKTVLAV